jgi:hypothetical protein
MSLLYNQNELIRGERYLHYIICYHKVRHCALDVLYPCNAPGIGVRRNTSLHQRLDGNLPCHSGGVVGTALGLALA